MNHFHHFAGLHGHGGGEGLIIGLVFLVVVIALVRR